MSPALRKAIFFLFLGIFLVSAPLVVLFTAGYRFNPTNRIVSQTGALALATLPRGANTYISGVLVSDKTPSVLQRLSPGSPTIRFEREGYLPWERKVDVESGRTTYVTAPLFFDAAPVALEDGSKESIAALDLQLKDEPALPSSLALVDNGANIEVRVNGLAGSQTLIGLLPEETYEPVVVDSDDLVLRNSKQQLYVLSTKNGSQPQALPMAAHALSWNEEERSLAWTDGTEVRTFDAATSMITMITRQSTPITSVSWSHDGYAVLVATATDLTAWDKTSYADGRFSLTLFTLDEPAAIWFDDEGKDCYYKFIESEDNTVYLRELTR